MRKTYTVSLDKIIQDAALQSVYLPRPADQIVVSASEVNRPGLPLAGYLEYFDNSRIQVLGNTEFGFLKNMTDEQSRARLDELIGCKPPAIVITSDLEVWEPLLQACQKHEVALLRTSESTSSFVASLISFLNVQLAPRMTRHGVFVEVYGEGIFIAGDSGVGKSETAIELIKRGHRLVADDAVEIRRVSSKTLVGSAPDNIRHFMELRGVGIVNASRIFGMGSVKMTEKIDMVIQLELWDDQKVYDRMGLTNEYTEILGITVPKLVIPVKPGRNLAIIIEVAAINNRQKRTGYNAAQDLMDQLGLSTAATPVPNSDWNKF
jgi:HPr kinase/phosphorylase